jgi:predicted nucleic acid-binding Zn ribbon protein
MAYNLPNEYNYTTISCRQQAEVMKNNENEHIRSIGHCEARHKKKYKRLKLGGGQA